MDVDNFEPRTIVNGAYLKRFINKQVSIFLKVQNVASGGKTILAESVDKQKINVILMCPLNMPLDGWIEVIGTPIGNCDNIKCSEIISFEQNEGDEKFDEEAHNMLVNFLHNCPDLYKDREE